MSSFLTLTNRVARRLGWNDLTASGFATAGSPYREIKDFLNEAKDDVLDELDLDLVEQEFTFICSATKTAGTVNGSNLINGFVQGTFVDGVAPPYSTSFASSDLNRKIQSPGFEGWFRITTVVTATQFLGLDGQILANFLDQSYTIYDDEFDLDASARQIQGAWVNDGPLDLTFLDDPDEFDRRHPGETTLGTPREAALYRSTTSGIIWQMRLRPIPDQRYTIRYKALTVLTDLSLSTDDWNLPSEIERFIVDEAYIKAAESSVLNDLEAADFVTRRLSRKLNSYRNKNWRRSIPERLRRKAPDEIERRLRAHFDPTRFR